MAKYENHRAEPAPCHHECRFHLMSDDPTPQQRLPPPLPTASLEYARPGTVKLGRPILISIVGIACLAVAVLAATLGLFYAPDAHKLHAMAIPPANASPPAPLVAPKLTSHTGDVIGERGLKRADREKFVQAVVKASPALNADRRVILDWFLADAGADVPLDDVTKVTQADQGPDGKGALGTTVIHSTNGGKLPARQHRSVLHRPRRTHLAAAVVRIHAGRRPNAMVVGVDRSFVGRKPATGRYAHVQGPELFLQQPRGAERNASLVAHRRNAPPRPAAVRWFEGNTADRSPKHQSGRKRRRHFGDRLAERLFLDPAQWRDSASPAQPTI